MKYKILAGEWVSVYTTQTLIVDTDKDLESLTSEQVVDLLESDDNTTFEIEKEDFDWTTEEHEDWDRNEYGTKIIEKIGE